MNPIVKEMTAVLSELRADMPTHHPRAKWFAAIIALAVVASASGIANGFTLDDVAIVRDNARVHTLHQWWHLFGLSYWPPQYGASLYRPLLTLGFAVEWTLGAGAPWVFHATSIVLYAALCGLVLALLLEAIPLLAAVPAAALFAVHPVHVEAVANVVGQSELIAAIAMVGSALLYIRARRRGPLGASSIAGIAALFMAGCLSKEHALLLPLLLVALELYVVDGEGTSGLARLRTRIAQTAPLYVLLGILGLGYLATRTFVLGDLLGEKHPVPVYGIQRLWVMLVVAPHWVRLLAWPAHLSADYSPQQIVVPAGPGPEIVLGVVVLTAAAIGFAALGSGSEATRRLRNTARLALAWMAITLLPVTNLFSVMIVEERTLLMPSVGAMVLAGVLIALLWNRMETRPHARVARQGLIAVVALLIVLGTVKSGTRQRIWRDDATLFAQTVEDAPRSYRAQFFYGQMLFEQGKRAEGERHLRLAIALNPTRSDVSPLNYLATQYRDAGLCPQAVPLYERALEGDDQRPDVRYGLAACLLATGRVEQARRLAMDGVRRGDLKSLFQALVAKADST